MASTITPTTLSVKVSETITLNGTTFDTINTQEIQNVGNYVNNVFNIQPGTQEILAFSRAGVAPRDKEYDVDLVKYIRLTNADDTTDVKIVMGYTASADQNITLEAGGTFVMSNLFLAPADTLQTISIVTTAAVDIPYAIGSITA